MNREPCLVCGHPTGDCCGASTVPVKIIGANIFPSLGYQDVFVVEEDYYENRSIVQGQDWNPEGFHKKIRRFRKGQVIPMSVAIQHGLAQA